MSRETGQELPQSTVDSLAFDHYVLVCLDVAKGKPVSADSLVQSWWDRMVGAIERGNSFFKKIPYDRCEIEEDVKDCLSYMQRLRLVEVFEDVETRQDLANITAMGHLMALGLPHPQELPPNQILPAESLT